MTNLDLMKVNHAAVKVCGSDVTVEQTDFDKTAFVIEPCTVEQFRRLCVSLKGSGHHIQPLSIGPYSYSKGVICNLGQY